MARFGIKYLTFLVERIPFLICNTTRKEVDLLSFLTAFVSKGKYGLRSVIGKMYAIRMICKHPELSDEKVKDITNMMS